MNRLTRAMGSHPMVIAYDMTRWSSSSSSSGWLNLALGQGDTVNVGYFFLSGAAVVCSHHRALEK